MPKLIAVLILTPMEKNVGLCNVDWPVEHLVWQELPTFPDTVIVSLSDGTTH